MSFRSYNDNPLADIVDLQSVLDVGDPQNGAYTLKAELAIFPGEVAVDQMIIKVSLRQVTLGLRLDGLDVVQGTRYGVDLVPEVIETRTAVDQEIVTSVEAVVATKAIAEGEITPLLQQAKLGATRDKSRTDKSTATLRQKSERRTTHHPVRAMGNNNWRVSEPSDSELDHHYLNDTPLCELRHNSVNPNRIATTLAVSTPARQVTTTVLKDDKLLRLSHNKERVLAILVAKALNKVSGSAEYNGEVTFSTSTAEYEG
ncbi:hypothetical protein [Ancylobacter amanitiformis]|uniref:Uncharacterized protein n=1 Tax=Ancylobacter amanitiformis TaxID=217069 RepID=A0ABU0LXY2_9HYPH|nr:hypothetical protein [Ancylobacter amanitiformis]MDQ0513527.1 hypothetical protein [Ancylobacter amanitiformis]